MKEESPRFSAGECQLTDKVIKQVKGDKHRQLGEYQKLNDVDPHWAKNENWKLAQAMSLSDLENTDLGAFLQQECLR